ncbi:MAG TPA: hypothetical protein VI259_10685 [Gemmatimonadaceae bacterium]
MSETLSATERALLRVFQQKGAFEGVPVPTSVLWETVVFAGAPSSNGEIETALLGLQVRGFIVPGSDPFSATSWMLTPLGDQIVNSGLDHHQR